MEEHGLRELGTTTRIFGLQLEQVRGGQRELSNDLLFLSAVIGEINMMNIYMGETWLSGEIGEMPTKF
jgi:hypothetical protein